MDNRFQYILLKTNAAILLIVLLFASALSAAESNGDQTAAKADISDINNEVFELGVFVGVINIEDFSSEFFPGVSATFRASEDFFIQYNYLQTDVSLSSYEKNQGKLFEGDDRTFRHYDLLIGYNLFQGEFFRSSKANLSTLYLVAGVGDTEFGGESSMTYTVGIGYQVALTRHFGLHFDFRDYIYESTLVSDENRTVSAAQISSGIKYSF